MKPSVTLFLDASRPDKEGICLVKLNIYYNGVKRRYKTPFHFSREDWKRVNGVKIKEEGLKGSRKKIEEFKGKVEKLVAGLDPFTFEGFEAAYLAGDKEKSKDTLKEWFDRYIQKLKDNKQTGTAISYQTTINSLKDYGEVTLIKDVTPDYLEGYEQWMLKNGKSPSTIGIYLRQLRAIINQALKAKVITEYPFRDYQIPNSRNIKKALTEEQIYKLLSFKPVLEDRRRALDFWLFSYLCNGMNFTDIAHLKKTDIIGNFLYFRRQKTKNTKKKDLRDIKVPLNPKALEILLRRRDNNPHYPYLFLILDMDDSSKTVKNKCQRFIKWVNKRMQLIGQELGMGEITTYTARHTFATLLKRKGVPTSYIKDALGHSTEATTEHYLDSFENAVALQYANLLTDFNK